MNGIEIFGETELRLMVNFIFCLIAGIMIGAERESRGKDAGISTHTMVILGAMLFTFLSSVVDPASQSRIAAQIVSGIGFLGAGLILKDGANVKNLTTAASIWVAGAIGMAFGFSYYAIGFLVAVASTLIPRLPHYNQMSPEALASGIKKTGQKINPTNKKNK